LGIPTGLVFGEYYLRSSLWVKIILLFIVLISSIPGVADFEMKYVLPQSRLVIPADYLALMRTINQIVPAHKALVYIPVPHSYPEKYLPQDTLTVPSFTGRSLYFGTGGLPSNKQQERQKRIKLQAKLVNSLKTC